MNRCLFGERDFAKIDEHLLSGRRIEYMVINAPVFLTCIELARSFQEVYIVSQSLFISWQAYRPLKKVLNGRCKKVFYRACKKVLTEGCKNLLTAA